MIVNSLFYGTFRCTAVMFDRVSFYRGFVYNIGIFLVRACVFDPTIALVGGMYCTVDVCDFFIVVFYYLGHAACATVANLNVVFVKDFG